jgi:hypothetical protein
MPYVQRRRIAIRDSIRLGLDIEPNKRDVASGCVVIVKKSKPNDEIVLYSSINAHDNNKLNQSQITDAYEHVNGTPIVPEKHLKTEKRPDKV